MVARVATLMLLGRSAGRPITDVGYREEWRFRLGKDVESLMLLCGQSVTVPPKGIIYVCIWQRPILQGRAWWTRRIPNILRKLSAPNPGSSCYFSETSLAFDFLSGMRSVTVPLLVTCVPCKNHGCRHQRMSRLYFPYRC